MFSFGYQVQRAFAGAHMLTIARRANTLPRLTRGALSERGQATAEYAVVILIAAALGMAVLTLFTSGLFNSILGAMIKKVLEVATSKINW